MPRTILLYALCVLGLLFGSGSAGERIRISFIPRAVSTEYWITVRRGAESAAINHPDLEFSFTGPQHQDSLEEQIDIIRHELKAGSQVMIIAPSDEKRIVEVLDVLHASDVKVILYDSEAAWPHVAGRIGSNNVMGGYLAAEYIASRLHGRGKVAVITGPPSTSPAISRANGAREALRVRRGIKLAQVAYGDWTRESGYARTLELLEAHPDLDAIFCGNDDMAIGALSAVRSSGSDAFVVGFDATPTSLRSILSGGLAATVAQNSFNMGRLAVRAAYRAAKGRKIPSALDTGMQLVTAENVDEFLEGVRDH